MSAESFGRFIDAKLNQIGQWVDTVEIMQIIVILGCVLLAFQLVQFGVNLIRSARHRTDRRENAPERPSDRPGRDSGPSVVRSPAVTRKTLARLVAFVTDFAEQAAEVVTILEGESEISRDQKPNLGTPKDEISRDQKPILVTRKSERGSSESQSLSLDAIEKASAINRTTLEVASELADDFADRRGFDSIQVHQNHIVFIADERFRGVIREWAKEHGEGVDIRFEPKEPKPVKVRMQRRCPHCQSLRVTPIGVSVGDNVMMWRCDACSKSFPNSATKTDRPAPSPAPPSKPMRIPTALEAMEALSKAPVNSDDVSGQNMEVLAAQIRPADYDPDDFPPSFHPQK